MIIKILPRTAGSIRALLAYIQREGKGIDGQPQLILHNIRSHDIDGQTRELLENQAYRKHIRRDMVSFRHEILSLSKHETGVTREIMEDLVRQYIRTRGTRGLYIASVHGDRQHYHAHIITGGCELKTGKSFHPKRPELHRIKMEMQEYHKQRYPHLSHSICEHGAGREYLNEREYKMKQRTNRSLKKEQIAVLAQECFAKANSQENFLNRLQEQNLHHYDRKGIPQGIILGGMKMRFTRMNIPFTDLPHDQREELRIFNELKQLHENLRHRRRDIDLER